MKHFIKYFLSTILIIASITLNAQESYPLETIIQKGHLKYVTCAAFSPNSKFIVTGSYDNTIKLWDLESAKEIRSFNQHTDRIKSIVFSPDGNKILSTSGDNTAIIFDILTGKVLQTFTIDAESLVKAVFSPDGNKVLTMNNRDETKVWDIATGKEIGTYSKSFKSSIQPTWYSPDGKKLLSFVDYKQAKIVDIESKKDLFFLDFDKTFSMTFSPDGKYIALGSAKLFAKVFNSETGKEINRFEDDKNVQCDGCNMQVAISNSNKYLLTGTKKAGLILWDIEKGTKLKTFKDCTESLNYIKFSSSDKYVLAINDQNILVFNTKTGNQVVEIKTEHLDIFEPYFSPDDKYIITPNKNNTAALWNISNASIEKVYKGYLNKDRTDGLNFSYNDWTDVSILKYLSAKSGITISPDGKYMVKGNIDSTLIMIDISTGKIAKEFVGHSKIVYCFDFNKTGDILASAGGDNYIKLWNTKTGKEIMTLKGHKELIFDIKFSSDGKYLVSGSWDSSIRIWDVASGKQIQIIKLDNISPYVVGFTPNNMYVVSGDLNKQLKLWELDAGAEFRTIIGHTEILSSFDFTPDGKTMITGSWDGKIKIWDVLTGMLLTKLENHRGAVYSVCCDPNGKFIASGSSDRTIKLWDITTGKEIKTLEGNSNSVTSVKITPDGKKLISCTVDGVIKVWDLSTFKELYTYFQIDRDNWLAKNSLGYFDGTKEALKSVNYVSGMEVIAIGSLFEKYYTPNLIKRITEGESFSELSGNLNEVIKESPKITIRIEDTQKHEISLVDDSIYNWREKIIPIIVDISDQGGALDEIRIYNNEKLILNESLSSEIVFRGGNKLSNKYNIQLSDGKNEIKTVVINKERTESFPSKIIINYDGEDALTDLYILSIGINKYKNPKYDLSFATNDAKAYSKALKENANQIFHNVEEVFIKDENANKENITKQFEEFSKKIGPEDVFLFYYAGHGVMSLENKKGESDFYIVTYDVTNLYGDAEILKEKAISASELMEFSRKIKAGKQLFILDACQSGGAVEAFAKRGASREKAIAQLARSTGTFFITASQESQFANEAGTLEHGLFTYAILEALEGKANGGLKDDKITANELKTYVEERVPELSEKYHGSPQYPTGYSFGQDFPIVIINSK